MIGWVAAQDLSTAARGCFSEYFFFGSFRISMPSLDVPRGLRSRGHPDAAGGRPEGTRTFRQIILYAVALVGVSLLRQYWAAGVMYFFGALVTSTALVQSVPVGSQQQDKHSGQVAHARYGSAYSLVARLDGLRQTPA